MNKTIKMYGSDLITLKEELKEAQVKHDLVNGLLSDLFDRAGVIEAVNLKLYEIAFKAGTEDFEGYFDVFCEGAYYDFKELLKEDGLEMRHVGRSSFFYIEARDVAFWLDPSYYDWKTMDLEDFINNMARAVDIPPALVEYNTFNDALSAGLALDPIEAVLSDLISDYDHFIESVYNDLSDQLEAIKTAYAYIEDFKRDQVKLWGEYIEEVKEYT